MLQLPNVGCCLHGNDTVSRFASRLLLQAYGGDELLLVADPGSKYGENFYFVLNDALKASELKVRGSRRMLRRSADAPVI